jgi:hypothetical protein
MAPAPETSAATRERRRITPADARRFAAQWIRASPGTHIWLLILAVTSGIVAGASPHARSYLLHHVSTNLVELHHHPLRVLFASALWIETPSGFVLYLVLFELVHAPAERWLGTWRWLVVVATAHIGATLVSEKAVMFGIRDERLPRSLAHTVDIGVSYGLAGIVGVLTYFVPRPWRWGYLAGVLLFFGYPLLGSPTFTDLGHFTAALIGLSCYAITPPGRARQEARPPGPERNGPERNGPTSPG